MEVRLLKQTFLPGGPIFLEAKCSNQSCPKTVKRIYLQIFLVYSTLIKNKWKEAKVQLGDNRNLSQSKIALIGQENKTFEAQFLIPVSVPSVVNGQKVGLPLPPTTLTPNLRIEYFIRFKVTHACTVFDSKFTSERIMFTMHQCFKHAADRLQIVP